MVDIIYTHGRSGLFYSLGTHVGHVRVRSPGVSTGQVVWLFPYDKKGMQKLRLSTEPLDEVTCQTSNDSQLLSFGINFEDFQR